MSAKKREAFYPERIEQGRFVTRAVNQLMRQYEGKQVEVCIRAKRYYTTQPQRGYYWGVVIFLIGERMRSDGVTGRMGGPITDQEVHELMACKFLRFSVCIDFETGECIDLVKSTSELTVGEMADYITQVMAWAIEHFNAHNVDADGNPVVDVDKQFDIPEANKQLAFV
jgi:hypothetical protein